MAYRILRASEAHWRRSNQMGVANTDLAHQLQANSFGARLWRLAPGQASTRHRHREADELYVLIEGRGRIRIGDELHTTEPLDAVLVEAPEIRQIFNDTSREQLWLILGAPHEPADSRQLSPEALAWAYPDGPKALPPELETPEPS